MMGRFIRARYRQKLCYNGGMKGCMWVKENTGVVLRLVKEVMGDGIRGRLMWYILKYNRIELLPLGCDGDVRKLLNDNDEYAYLCMAGSKGPCMGRLHRNEAYKGQ